MDTTAHLPHSAAAPSGTTADNLNLRAPPTTATASFTLPQRNARSKRSAADPSEVCNRRLRAQNSKNSDGAAFTRRPGSTSGPSADFRRQGAQRVKLRDQPMLEHSKGAITLEENAAPRRIISLDGVPQQTVRAAVVAAIAADAAALP
jgi:hypothetical protein